MATCWNDHGGSTGNATGSIPCGVTNSSDPYVACCVRGDYCMSDSICHYTHSLDGGTGYYVADCTDPNFDSPNCRKACSNETFADIVYNSDLEVWQCCSYSDGSATPDCDSPTNENFAAPDPSDLVTLQFLPASGSPTYATSSVTATASATSTFASSSATTSSAPSGSSTSSGPSASNTLTGDDSHSSGLSSAAAIGIGIGVGLAAVLVIGLLIAWLLRKRKSGKQDELLELHSNPQPYNDHVVYAKGSQPVEMNGTDIPALGHSHGERHELQVPPAELDSGQK